uniref:hypothetical protein n=1 Tax=Paenarthrobacter histidinolovorans TaxID=43664 RepID=UPI003898FEE5
MGVARTNQNVRAKVVLHRRSAHRRNTISQELRARVDDRVARNEAPTHTSPNKHTATGQAEPVVHRTAGHIVSGNAVLVEDPARVEAVLNERVRQLGVSACA